MKIAGKILIATAIVGGIAAGVAAALRTQKGQEIKGKVVDAAKTGVTKAKEGVGKVKDKFAKKPQGDDVVAETTCEEMCEEVTEEIYEDDLPEIAPEDVPTEEVSVDEA